MAKNRLWTIDYKTVRAHTQDKKSRLLQITHSTIVNWYYYKQRNYAWDINLPMDSSEAAERILEVSLERGY
jgi:hypothetical protein